MIGSVGSYSGGHSALTNQALPPIKKEKVEVDASNKPAELHIRTRNAEMDADWDGVWQELGMLKLYGQIREITAISKEEGVKAISRQVQDGLMARNIHTNKGNVFGQMAFNKYMANKKQVQIAALPRFGVNIDIRVYPPEIEVKVNVKGVSDS